MTRKRRKVFCILLFLTQAILHVKCTNDTTALQIAGSSKKTVITPKISTQEEDDHETQRMYGKSYIQKFSNSWKVFAKANDITKREKLKKALADALISMDHRRRDEVSSVIDDKTVQRIKHAASLLKQFKQMYALSENVKRTLLTYNEAKQSLTDIAHSKEGLGILKRFLQKHSTQTKRNQIPLHSSNFATLIDQVVSETSDVEDPQLIEPTYITKTDKITLKAALLGKIGKIGMEFASVDPRTSSIEKAEKAFRAARILMQYVALEKSKKKSETGDISDMLSSLHTHLDDTEVHDSSMKKSIFPTSRAHADIANTGLTHIIHESNETSEEQVDTVLETLVTDEDTQNSKVSSKSDVTNQNNTIKEDTLKEVKVEPQHEDKSKRRSNPYVALLKKILKRRNETMESSKKNNTKKDTTEKWIGDKKNESLATATDSEKSVVIGNETETSILESSSKSTINDTVSTLNSSSDALKGSDSGSKNNSALVAREKNGESAVKSLEGVLVMKKQQDALERLQEAKQARQKYEIAKHELAQKVKELYVLANDYEKQETNDQILEVKNFIASTPQFEETSHNVKRDDSHPGVALAGIHSRKLERISTSASDDSKHKGFTMGMIDKKEHQIELEDPKSNDEVKKVYDVGLPSNVKLEDFASDKKTKSQEETLKVIAQAIQEDMADISSTEKQKMKLLASALPSGGITPLSNATHSRGDKKGGPPADKIDEYLTKALADIMGNDSASSTTDSGKDSGKANDQSNQDDRNRKIVEKAMAQHAANPGINLPLVETKGGKVILNKDGNTNNKSNADQPQKSNDRFAHASDRDTNDKNKGLDLGDPENKALLDKATHMEEQVAAAQDKLYSSEPSKEPPVAAPNTEYIPPPMKYEPSSYRESHRYADPYGSINGDPERVPMSQQEPQQEYDGPDEEPPERERYEGPEDEEDAEPMRRHHRERYHEPDDDEDEDDDRDDDDEKEDDDEPDDYKKSRVGYRDDTAQKRTLPNKQSINTSPEVKTAKLTNKETGGSVTEEKHIEELEDSKKSFVPGSNLSSNEVRNILSKSFVATRSNHGNPMPALRNG